MLKLTAFLTGLVIIIVTFWIYNTNYDIKIKPSVTIKDTFRMNGYFDIFDSFTPCNRENNIFYLKTYKTGSTTMAAILYHYAVRLSLKVVPLFHDTFPAEIKAWCKFLCISGEAKLLPAIEHTIYN